MDEKNELRKSTNSKEANVIKQTLLFFERKYRINTIHVAMHGAPSNIKPEHLNKWMLDFTLYLKADGDINEINTIT